MAMQLSSVPRFSAHDPAASGEGSLDPLGMEASAERLAEQLLPGMTARMERVRMLTFMAVSAHVTDPYADDYTKDQTTPSFLVFEWMYAEALARDDTEAQGIPGIQTASKAVRGGGRLAARIYLKSPRALGMHGFYRRLAEATRIIDSSGRIRENGELLVEAWERGQGLDGFLENRGYGGVALWGLRRDLEEGLKSSKCELKLQSRGAMALRQSLTPAFRTRTSYERRFLRQILEEDERRKQSLELLDGVQNDNGLTERDLAVVIKRQGSKELASSARCLIAYENLAVLLQEAFDLLLWSATSHRMAPEPISRLTLTRHDQLAGTIVKAVARAHAAAEEVESDRRREELLRAFSDLGSGRELVKALVDRHEEVQAAKGQEGKMPWLQRSDAGLSVRSAYVREKKPEPNPGFMHPVRLRNARRFLEELA